MGVAGNLWEPDCLADEAESTIWPHDSGLASHHESAEMVGGLPDFNQMTPAICAEQILLVPQISVFRYRTLSQINPLLQQR